jgi:hypothetical protein
MAQTNEKAPTAPWILGLSIVIQPTVAGLLSLRLPKHKTNRGGARTEKNSPFSPAASFLGHLWRFFTSPGQDNTSPLSHTHTLLRSRSVGWWRRYELHPSHTPGVKKNKYQRTPNLQSCSVSTTDDLYYCLGCDGIMTATRSTRWKRRDRPCHRIYPF